ncbi:PQQ-dependent sugar dehydrogenase [Halalkalibacter hemicellulosilyticus]|nr:sorbosone dehydrogenase family protein [Halalkalibacter hemicellulosilyticus]
MKKYFVIPLFSILFLLGCFANDQPNMKSEESKPVNGGEIAVEDEEESQTVNGYEIIAEDLDIPWAIEKSENTIYLSERPGNIVKVEDGETEAQSVHLEKELATAAEAGLLGVVLDPQFLETQLAYAYYTYEDEDGQFNRVVTLRLEDNVWQEESVLLDHIPSGNVHHGGRIKIGPDEKLYVATGDAAEPQIAQDRDSLGGKILRMNLDGSIPDDNPFPNSYVYSYGHRNPQGLTWSSNGTMYSSEHGQTANDEINEIKSGQNYGWPIIEGREEKEEMLSPLFTSGSEETWAPSGMDYYDGKLYVATLRGEAVLEFDLETGEQREVISDIGRVRDVYVNGNSLYFISNNTDGRGEPDENDDRLYRIWLKYY